MGSGSFASCLLSVQGMCGLQWRFWKSPSPGLRPLVREQAAPFLAGLHRIVSLPCISASPSPPFTCSSFFLCFLEDTFSPNTLSFFTSHSEGWLPVLCSLVSRDRCAWFPDLGHL